VTIKVGSYEVEAELGRGGMGVVYKARHVPTGVERALKVVAAGASATAIERFKREVEALAKLGRSGVVAIHETGISSGRAYYIMELMPGGSLRARLDAGKIAWQDAVAIAIAIARTLERCHGLGLVHRDLKPENILFDEQGAPRLADFGCVKDLGAISLTKPGGLVGTLSYMSPEQMSGGRPDERTDVFSLGVMLHELVAGAHPFANGGTVFEFIANREKRTRPRLAPLAPAALDEVLDRAVEQDPELRTPTAQAFREELEAVLQGKTPAVNRRGRRWRLALLGAGALVVAGAAATAALRPPRGPETGVDAGSWTQAAQTLAPVDETGARIAALAATTLAQAADPVTAERAWETRARIAAASRPDEAEEAAARALELLGRSDPRARGLIELRVRALAALGRTAELRALVGERMEDLRLAADALTDAGRWDAVLSLPKGDPLLDVRRAWASHAKGGSLEELVNDLARTRDLPGPSQAALDVLRARVKIRSIVDHMTGFTAFNNAALEPLAKIASRCKEADPRLRERTAELALLEDLIDEQRLLDLPAEALQPIDKAMREVAGPGSDEDLDPLRVIFYWRWPRGEVETELKRELFAGMRARVPARYTLARSLQVGKELAKSVPFERAQIEAVLAESEKACLPPDAGDLRVDSESMITGGTFQPHSMAALALVLLATDAEGPARDAYLARAREHLAHQDEIKTMPEGQATRLMVRVIVDLADGKEDPEPLLRDSELAGTSCAETAFIHGEVDRKRGRLDGARDCFNVAAGLAETRFIHLISDLAKHEIPIATALLVFQDSAAAPEVRARLKKTLPSKALLPWIQDDVRHVLAEH
jgi:hypothetical protein